MKWGILAIFLCVVGIGTWWVFREDAGAEPVPPAPRVNGAPEITQQTAADPRERLSANPSLRSIPTPTTQNQTEASPMFKDSGEETEYLLRRARDTGISTAAWTQDAMTDLGAASQLLPPGTRLTKVECYVQACFVQVTYIDMAAYQKAFTVLDDAPSLTKWSRAVTGPDEDRASHVVRNAILLFHHD